MSTEPTTDPVPVPTQGTPPIPPADEPTVMMCATILFALSTPNMPLAIQQAMDLYAMFNKMNVAP
jgi:hypothetical protein